MSLITSSWFAVMHWPTSVLLEQSKRANTAPRNTLLFALAIVSMAFFAPSAHAVPSMARQTGYACARCHTVFPELTPFGRQFKLGAYAMSSQKWDARPWYERFPVAAALQVSRTSTSDTAAGGSSSEDFEHDRESLLQVLAGYYGGKITQNSGALVQYNYDGIERRWAIEMLDVRYSKAFALGETEVTYGVTLNNSPAVSDIYGSTPVWSFPHGETAAPQMPTSTMVDMMLAGQVGGVTAYAMWGEHIYTEAGFYRTAATGALRFVAAGNPTEIVLAGTNPYWRLALQNESGKHSFEVGTYGLRAKVRLDPADRSAGTNLFTDYALDGSYQFINGDHIFSTHATWIREKQSWDASFQQGLTSRASGSLTTSRADAHYFYRRRWGGGIQYFNVSGSDDALLYDTGDVVMGSATGSPDSQGWIVEANYLPLDWIKTSVRYTAFQKFNGASSDYMPGRNASDNNYLYVLAWVLF